MCAQWTTICTHRMTSLIWNLQKSSFDTWNIRKNENQALSRTHRKQHAWYIFFIQMYTKWVSSSYCAPFDLQNNFIPFCFVAFRLNRISSKLVRKWLIRLIKYSYSIIRSRFLVLISNWILDNLCITINGMYDSMDIIYGGDWTMLNSYKCLNFKR